MQQNAQITFAILLIFLNMSFLALLGLPIIMWGGPAIALDRSIQPYTPNKTHLRWHRLKKLVS